MKTTDTHVYFYSGREVFSNWHSTISQFRDPLQNILFDNAEQAFMWYKATFFGNDGIAAEAAAETDPRAVKALGRKVQFYDDKSWECVRLGYMTYVNLLKYQQNAHFAAELLATGDRILVEASVPDRIWGVGLDESDPRILDSAQWRGRNLLGEALMTVRRLIRS